MSKWEWKKLGEVCDSINGLWKGKKEPFIKVGVIRNTNFTKNCRLDMNPSKLEFLDVEKKQYDKRKLLFGDLIVEKSGGSEKQPVGRVVLFEEKEGEYSFSNFTSVLRIKNDDEIECHFLHLQLYKLYLDGITKQMQSATTGIHNLDFDQFKDLSIGIPPLSEQKRIVKYLDEEFSKIDTLKTNAETNLKNAKALYQKSLDKIIEDECRRYTLTSLKEITTKIGSGATPKGGKKSYQTEGISLIRSMNVLYGSFSYDNLAHINEKQAKALDGVAIQCADVLFNITGASIARCCVVPDDVIPARVNQHVSILRPIQKVLNSDYLSVVLLASQNQKKLLDIGEAGATRQALTKGDLEVFPIPLPPLSVQKEIVARLDKLSENVKRLEANYKQIIANCDELKKSILKKTFEGES